MSGTSAPDPPLRNGSSIICLDLNLNLNLAENAGLTQRLDELEKKYDVQFKVVFAAIRSLMQPPEPKKKRIGFITADDKTGQTGSGSDFIARDHPRRRPHR